MLCLLATSVLPAAIFVKPLSEHKYTYKILSQIPLIFNLYSRKMGCAINNSGRIIYSAV